MWKVGVPSDPSASMGALISKAHLEKVSKSLPCQLFGEKLHARHSTNPCLEILSITALFLKNYNLWKIVSGYRV